jgi:hypothetical protein
MVELRYSNSGISVEGTSKELLAIKARILGLADVGAEKIELSGDSGSPSPYDLLLKRLVISGARLFKSLSSGARPTRT